MYSHCTIVATLHVGSMAAAFAALEMLREIAIELQMGIYAAVYHGVG